MLERSKQLFPDGREVVLCNQEGEWVRVSVDKNTQIEELIREREGLGESVVAITSLSEAIKLIESQHAQRMRDSTSDFQLKRF